MMPLLYHDTWCFADKQYLLEITQSVVNWDLINIHYDGVIVLFACISGYMWT